MIYDLHVYKKQKNGVPLYKLISYKEYLFAKLSILYEMLIYYIIAVKTIEIRGIPPPSLFMTFRHTSYTKYMFRHMYS